jgi:peptide/nickel transport system substrate-binding protein
LRTLLSHSGRTTEDGGAALLPDLASKLPDVSADGLTWTFHLKEGIHYAPPLQATQVTAGDFIRAFRREAKIGKDFYSFYFDVIRGFDDYAAGKTDTISGLEAPDPATLLIRLATPAGDLGNRLVLAATAPIPPLASQPDAPFGVATGHDKDGYGAYLVATGPYMVEGSEKLDFSLPAKQQPKLAGFLAGHFITLVRNPSWKAASDALRAAYVDRIDIKVLPGDPTSIQKMVTTGAADLDLNGNPPEQPLFDLANKVRSDPSLGSVHVARRDFVRYASFNVAVPPFDDVHIRRAFNFAVNKERIQQILGGPLDGAIAGHVALDSVENNLLIAYDPYHTAQDAGDVALAKAEVRQSRYDKNHDGVCDAAVCRDVLGLSIGFGSFPGVGKEVARDVLPLGIHIRAVAETSDKLFPAISDPKTHTPLALTIGWGKDYLNASNFFVPLFSRNQLPGNDHSLLGATPAELRGWGYKVASVPAVDDRINQCLGLYGNTQIQCWASLDQYLTEQIVPWVPLLFEQNIYLTSTRVVAYSFDQFSNAPSLDRLAVRPGS